MKATHFQKKNVRPFDLIRFALIANSTVGEQMFNGSVTPDDVVVVDFLRTQSNV